MIEGAKLRPRGPQRPYMHDRASAWTKATMDGRQAHTGCPDVPGGNNQLNSSASCSATSAIHAAQVADSFRVDRII